MSGAMVSGRESDRVADAIVARDLRRIYGQGHNRVHALQGASLNVDRGEMVALVGPSGSGKTTLLNCLVGLDRPESGATQVLGTSIEDLDYEAAVAWRRNHVAIVFQATGLLPHLTARENIDIVLRIRGVARRERRTRSVAALDQMGIGEFAEHRPAELSGGQQQRVSLARALASQPALLIADEPTAQLDIDTTVTVLHELRAAASAIGTTVLIATHDVTAQDFADRSVRMLDGCVTKVER